MTGCRNARISISNKGSFAIIPCYGISKLYKVDIDGSNMQWIAGSGATSSIDGIGTSATIYNPRCVIIFPDDNTLLIGQYRGEHTRKFFLDSGIVSTIYTSNTNMYTMLPNPSFTKVYATGLVNGISARTIYDITVCESCPTGTTSLPGLAPTRCNCTNQCGENQKNVGGTCQSCPADQPLAPAGKAAASDTGCDLTTYCAENQYLGNDQNTYEVFQYTGTVQTWTVPAGVTEITAYVWGAGGGGCGETNSGSIVKSWGGSGGFVKANINISSVTSLKFVVGEGGKGSVNTASSGEWLNAGGWGGGGQGETNYFAYSTGGGGGLSGIFLNDGFGITSSSGVVNGSSVPVLISGAGGGGGTYTSGIASGGGGGNGASLTGGKAGGYETTVANSGKGGTDGTTSPNGAGGDGANDNGEAGIKYKGGNSNTAFGAGGGAGWYGGGGGGHTSGGTIGGGGGGSSYWGHPTVTYIADVGGGDGTSTGSTAPNTAAYVSGFTVPSGIAQGGATSTTYNGGNGLIVIQYRSCNPCPVGTYSKAGSASECYCKPNPCKVNQYVDVNTGICNACPAGKISAGYRARSLQDCVNPSLCTGNSYSRFDTILISPVVNHIIIPGTATVYYLTYLGSGTQTSYTVTFSTDVFLDILVIAGGGGGAGRHGGGGGAGGLIYEMDVSIAAGTYTALVGNGGAGGGGTSARTGVDGYNSVIFTYTAIGGGGGGSWNDATNGRTGGSGGGTGRSGAGGLGTPGQGYNGGAFGTDYHHGGGGGAGGPGQDGGGTCGNGGVGRMIDIDGTNKFYAGGGAGTCYNPSTIFCVGGEGGGGSSAYYNATSVSTVVAVNGEDGKGGGGGAGAVATYDTPGARGGSGIVILKIKCKGCNPGEVAVPGATSSDFCQPSTNELIDYYPGAEEGIYNKCPDGTVSPPFISTTIDYCKKPSTCREGYYGDGAVTDIWDVTTLAGDGWADLRDGPGEFARFNKPYNLMCGETFALVADGNNNAIRKVDIDTGYTSTIAGQKTAGYLDGIGTAAQFRMPIDVTLTKDELTAYVVDNGNNCIRKINLLTMQVTTFTGTCRTTDISYVGSNIASNTFNNPRGAALSDTDQWLVVVDEDHMRKINIATGDVYSVVSVPGADMVPAGIDLIGDMAYVACKSHHSIKAVNWVDPVSCVDGTYGYVDAVGNLAKFYEPTGVAIDSAGKHILVADSLDHNIRWVDIDTLRVATIAGIAEWGYVDGSNPNDARFYIPWGVALTKDGRYALVSDQSNNRIRKMRVNGCNQCQPGYTSINGSYSVDFCQKSYCSNEPVRSDNSLQNAVNYYSQTNSSLDDTKVALWLDAKNVDGKHNDGLFRSSAYVKQWLDLSPYGRVFTPMSTFEANNYATMCDGLDLILTTGTVTVNTDIPSISWSTGYIPGFIKGTTAVFYVRTLNLASGVTVTFTGVNAVGFHLFGDVDNVIDTTLDVSNYNNKIGLLGAWGGGYNTGTNKGQGPGGGFPAGSCCYGGGGGGFGGRGGANGDNTILGGIAYGTSTLLPWNGKGGSGGGTGGTWLVGRKSGGAGGGALYFLSNSNIILDSHARILADGSDAIRETNDEREAGGGSGGALLIICKSNVYINNLAYVSARGGRTKDSYSARPGGNGGGGKIALLSTNLYIGNVLQVQVISNGTAFNQFDVSSPTGSLYYRLVDNTVQGDYGTVYIGPYQELTYADTFTTTAGYLMEPGVWITNNTAGYISGPGQSLPAVNTFFISVQSSKSYGQVWNSLTNNNISLQTSGYCPGYARYDRKDSVGTKASFMYWDGLRMDRNHDNVIITGQLNGSSYMRVKVDGRSGDWVRLTDLVSAAGTADGFIRIGEVFEGYLQEIIVVEGILTDQQVTSIHLYLSNKWRVSKRKMDSDSDGIKDYSDLDNNVPGCSECNPGNSFNGGTCRLCQKGKFGDYGDRCRWCTANSMSPTGSSSNTSCVCDDGHYKKAGECLLCPQGYYCVRVCQIN
eukprot:765506-Hanusia_phi.AAC.2